MFANSTGPLRLLGREAHGQLALQPLDLVLQGEGDPLVEQLGPLVVRRAAAQREQRGEVERRAEDDVDGRAWGQLGIGLGSRVVRSGLALGLGLGLGLGLDGGWACPAWGRRRSWSTRQWWAAPDRWLARVGVGGTG